MRTLIHAAAAVAAITLAVALIGGCENDLDPLAPSDGVIDLQASPSTIVLDPNKPFAPRDPETGLLVGSANINATVYDKTGHPLGGVAVTFSAAGGRLGSAVNPGEPPRPVITSVSGVATDVLKVMESDPASIVVTATSSIVSKTVTVTQTNAACRNVAPVANAGADKSVEVETEATTTVTLDGRNSSDAETANVAMLFVWDCGNSPHSDPVPAAGFATEFPQIVACVYKQVASGTTGAVFTATLTVTDGGNGLVNPATGELLCKKTATDTVKITLTLPPA